MMIDICGAAEPAKGAQCLRQLAWLGCLQPLAIWISHRDWHRHEITCTRMSCCGDNAEGTDLMNSSSARNLGRWQGPFSASQAEVGKAVGI